MATGSATTAPNAAPAIVPRRQTSVALTLGSLAGLLAAATVVPTVVPITRRLAAAEEALATQHARAAAEIAAGMYEANGELPASARDHLQVRALQVHEDKRLMAVEGPPLDWLDVETTCTARAALVVGPGRTRWAVACHDTPQRRVIAAWVPALSGYSDFIPLILVLSALSGITTAMGVLWLLSPIGQLRAALDRLSAGERGVTVKRTGLVELDDMVDQLNSVSEAIQMREDAILARIQVVQQFARMVAHEVRNPLQSLELLTSLIAEESDPEERNALARAIHDEIAALDKVVTGLLRDGSRSGGLHVQPRVQPIAPLVRQVVALRNAEAASRRTRIEVGPLSPVAIPVDAALLGRSIENLITNAMQLVPVGYGLIRVNLIDEGETVAIVVEDNGPGVDPAFGDHIFDADVTSRVGGTGLGLALVKSVIEAHGGYAAYDASPLGGARFVLRLPKPEEARGEPNAERAGGG